MITSQPASQSVSAGQPAQFSVGLQDASGVSYQWMRNGTDISGAAGASYTLAAAQLADSGSTWSVRVGNAGGTVTSNAATLTVSTAAPPLGVSLFAGRLGSPQGNTDGAGQAAHFYEAAGIAIDGAGNLYVADSRNATVRKITPGGVVTTLAGAPQAPGTADGAGASARFDFPNGLTLHSDGFLYVMDRGRVRRVSLAGVVTTVDTPTLPATAVPSEGATIASGRDGMLYVSRGYALYRFAPGGPAVLVAGSPGEFGTQDGVGAGARFGPIYGIAVDAQSVLYVGDGTGVVRRVGANGEVTTLAGTRGNGGFADGTGSAAVFRSPRWPALDAAGNIWVSDGTVLRRITPAGVVTTPYGDQPANPVSGALAFDAAGNLFVNYGTGVARIDTSSVAHELAGDTFVKADLAQPAFGPLAVDAQGTVYSFSTATRYSPSGQSQPLPEVLRTRMPFNSAVRYTTLAPDGNFIVTEPGFSSGGINVDNSNGGTISRVTPAGVKTVLASWSGPSAYTPGSAAVDAAGNIYFVDYFEHFAVRKLAPDGTVTTLAPGSGRTSYILDFRMPGIALSPSGAVHVAYGDRIAKLDAQGNVSVLWGATDGQGAQARGGSLPAFDAAGNLYAGVGNVVLKITPAGAVTTMAGVVSARGNTTGPLPASFGSIEGIAVTADGLIYVSSDRALLRIRQQ